jgi:hypothetical protein
MTLKEKVYPVRKFKKIFDMPNILNIKGKNKIEKEKIKIF